MFVNVRSGVFLWFTPLVYSVGQIINTRRRCALIGYAIGSLALEGGQCDYELFII